MTPQEIFDKVVDHAKRMTKKSTDNTLIKCLYRTPNGNRCFIGALIPDDMYDSQMEGCISIMKSYLPLEMNLWFGDNMVLLRDLQSIHDRVDRYAWLAALTNIALYHNLNPASLEGMSNDWAAMKSYCSDNQETLTSH